MSSSAAAAAAASRVALLETGLFNDHFKDVKPSDAIFRSSVPDNMIVIGNASKSDDRSSVESAAMYVECNSVGMQKRPFAENVAVDVGGNSGCSGTVLLYTDPVQLRGTEDVDGATRYRRGGGGGRGCGGDADHHCHCHGACACASWASHRGAMSITADRLAAGERGRVTAQLDARGSVLARSFLDVSGGTGGMLQPAPLREGLSGLSGSVDVRPSSVTVRTTDNRSSMMVMRFESESDSVSDVMRAGLDHTATGTVYVIGSTPYELCSRSFGQGEIELHWVNHCGGCNDDLDDGKGDGQVVLDPHLKNETVTLRRFIDQSEARRQQYSIRLVSDDNTTTVQATLRFPQDCAIVVTCSSSSSSNPGDGNDLYSRVLALSLSPTTTVVALNDHDGVFFVENVSLDDHDHRVFSFVLRPVDGASVTVLEQSVSAINSGAGATTLHQVSISDAHTLTVPLYRVRAMMTSSRVFILEDAASAALSELLPPVGDGYAEGDGHDKDNSNIVRAVTLKKTVAATPDAIVRVEVHDSVSVFAVVPPNEESTPASRLTLLPDQARLLDLTSTSTSEGEGKTVYVDVDVHLSGHPMRVRDVTAYPHHLHVKFEEYLPRATRRALLDAQDGHRDLVVGGPGMTAARQWQMCGKVRKDDNSCVLRRRDGLPIDPSSDVIRPGTVGFVLPVDRAASSRGRVFESAVAVGSTNACSSAALNVFGGLDLEGKLRLLSDDSKRAWALTLSKDVVSLGDACFITGKNVDFAGDVRVNGGVTARHYLTLSDRRCKTGIVQPAYAPVYAPECNGSNDDIMSPGTAVAELMDIPVCRFRYADETRERIGVVAQQLMQKLPSAVVGMNNDDDHQSGTSITETKIETVAEDENFTVMGHDDGTSDGRRRRPDRRRPLTEPLAVDTNEVLFRTVAALQEVVQELRRLRRVSTTT